MKTAVGAPARWQEIFDALDAMPPDALRRLAAAVLARYLLRART